MLLLYFFLNKITTGQLGVLFCFQFIVLPLSVIVMWLLYAESNE